MFVTIPRVSTPTIVNIYPPVNISAMNPQSKSRQKSQPNIAVKFVTMLRVIYLIIKNIYLLVNTSAMKSPQKVAKSRNPNIHANYVINPTVITLVYGDIRKHVMRNQRKKVNLKTK